MKYYTIKHTYAILGLNYLVVMAALMCCVIGFSIKRLWGVFLVLRFFCDFLRIKKSKREFLVVQWLGPCDSTAGA